MCNAPKKKTAPLRFDEERKDSLCVGVDMCSHALDMAYCALVESSDWKIQQVYSVIGLIKERIDKLGSELEAIEPEEV